MVRKKKFISDALLNLIACFIPVVVLQMIIYPILSRNMSDVNYGLMITIYSFISLIGGTLGSELNNLRLLKAEIYTDKKISGDFNLLICYGVVIVVLLMIGTSCIEGDLKFSNTCFSIIITMAIMLDDYLSVEFRLALNYRSILMNYIVGAVGYLIGLGLFYITSYWECIFLCGEIMRLIYLIFQTSLLREPIKKTELFKETVTDSLFLDIAGAFLRAMTYADKIILYPILGGTAVSIYYTATLFGKIISMGLNPLTSVLLSYLVTIKKLKKNVFRLSLLGGSIVCMMGYFICVAISRPVLEILFPQWVDEAMRYVPMTTLGVSIYALCIVLTPFVLKCCSIYWQIIINGAGLIVFVSLSYFLSKVYGLMGFCIGVTCSYMVRLILLIIAYKLFNRYQDKY